MKKFIRIIASVALMWAGTSHAIIINDFTGPYSASNWNITNSTGGGITVNNSDPTNLRFLINNPGVAQQNDANDLTYQIIVSGTGVLSFDWFVVGRFQQSTLGFLMVTSRELNLSDDIDSLSDDSGHIDTVVTAGELFEFRINSSGLRPTDILEFSVTGFSAPVAEPGVLLLIGLGLIGLKITQRRKA